MSLRGNLNSVDLANIFQMLSINQKEGTLNIFDGDSKRSIYFSRDGVSMLSRGKQKRDTLGRILLRYDRLSESQLRRAIEKQQHSGRILGVILEESDFVPREVVEDALRIQIEEEIYNLFIWKDASFEFIEGGPPKEFDELDGTLTRLTFNVNSLIMEAARRIDEWDQIQKVIPSMNEVFQYTGRNMELSDDIFREPYTEKVLAAINGRNTVEEIIEVSYVNKFEVCKVLALLIDQKAIEAVSASELTDAANAALEREAVPEAIKFLQRVIEIGDEPPEVHLSLGRAYESQDEIAKACAEFKRYAEAKLDLGEPQVAFDQYRHVAELLPTDLPAMERMIDIFVEHATSIEGQGRFVIDRGRSLAQVYVEIDKKDHAVQTLHRVISLNPEDFSLRNLLVNIYLASNMSSEAIAEYETMAEFHTRKRDWDQVVKILRKILVIDRSRDDVNSRLQQLLGRKEKKKRNIRRLVVVVIVLLGLSVLGYGYMNYELDARRQTAIAEQEAAKLLSDLNQQAQPIREDLEQLSARLADGSVDLDELVDAYRRAQALQSEYLGGVETAIQKLEDVASRYKFARARDEAVARQEDLRTMKADFESAIAQAGRKIQERALALVDDADEARIEGQASRALELYRRAWDIAIDRVPLENRNVDRKLASAVELVKELEGLFATLKERLAKEDYDGATAAGMKILDLYYASEVLNELTMPVHVESDPPGATVRINGEDTGAVTPTWITYHPGLSTEVTLTLDGFTPASEVIAPARVDLPDREMTRIASLKRIHKKLQKEVAWTESLGGAVEGRPIRVGNRLLVPTRTSQIWSVDLTERTTKVFVDLREESVSGIHSGPALSADGLYFATLEGQIRRVSMETGQTVWAQPGQAMIYAPLTVAGEFLIVGDVNGRISARDCASGEVAWRHKVVGEIRARPVVSGDRLYIVTTEGRLNLFELTTGNPIWETVVGSAGQPIHGSPLVVGDRIYVASTDGHLYAYEAGTEEPLWVFDTGSELRTEPVLMQGAVIVTTFEGKVFAIRDGEEVATLDIGGTTRAGPDVDGTRIFFVSDAGRLVSAEFDGESFRIHWRHDIRGPEGETLVVRVSPMVMGSQIVVLAESGEFFVLME